MTFPAICDVSLSSHWGEDVGFIRALLYGSVRCVFVRCAVVAGARLVVVLFLLPIDGVVCISHDVVVGVKPYGLQFISYRVSSFCDMCDCLWQWVADFCLRVLGWLALS